MLTDAEVEQMFTQLRTPEAGRRLVRDIRANSPVRKQQHVMSGVRTRFISRKMNGRALYAESRTCELPGVYIREFDGATLEMWPQPCELSLEIPGERRGRTRVLHTPDLFVISDDGFVIEERREEERLLTLAAKFPHRYYKDTQGRWHYRQAEEHLGKLGIRYLLRSADEHPRTFLSNLELLADYSLETTPLVPAAEVQRLRLLLEQELKVAHLDLIEDHGFSADHVFQCLLSGDAYVNLYETLLSDTLELQIFKDQYTALAVHFVATSARPGNVLDIVQGALIEYAGARLKVALVGKERVTLVDSDSGEISELELSLVRRLHQGRLLSHAGFSPDDDQMAFDMVLSNRALIKAAKRLEQLAMGESSGLSRRTLQRLKSAVANKDTPQERLRALAPKVGGNRSARLPQETYDVANEVLQASYNTPEKPTISAAFSHYVAACSKRNVLTMSRASFYRWTLPKTNTLAREGRRRDYQVSPIPLTFDWGSPVHGVLPHEVAYCDHTPMNVMLRGKRIPNLGKPTLTLMVDGAVAGARAFSISFRPPGVHAVFQCLRDYVRRHACLPRILVLDNGAEFHSRDLLEFCKIFNVTIRWRRSAKPRDSGVIERSLGVVEQELLQQLEGNSVHLKNPREVSPSHHPEKRIRWTLASLHGSLDYYLFDVHANRIHPRLGISPLEEEARLNAELGKRAHRLVRYDQEFKLLTSPHPRIAKRRVDPIRGVFVEGVYYWHEAFNDARFFRATHAEVRLELWRADVVYVCYRDRWHVARARGSVGLEGRFRPELAIQNREERIEAKRRAQRDKTTPQTSTKRVRLWDYSNWDEEAREALMEEHRLYHRLGMTEALPQAANEHAHVNTLPMPKLELAEDTDPLQEDGDFPVDETPPNETELEIAPAEAAEPSPVELPVAPTAGNPTLSKPPRASPRRSAGAQGKAGSGVSDLDAFIQGLDGEAYF